MIRFLTLCIALIGLYLGFSIASQFDSNLDLTIFDYKIETTFFTFISLFFIVQLILIMILRLVFLLLDLPITILESWNKRKIRRANELLLNALSDLVIGNRQKSLESIGKILPEFGKNNEELINLISAETDSNFDSRVNSLTKLINKKNYSIYASKSLAIMFLEKGDYKEAEKYANKAFNENDADLQVILILIRIYARLKAWSKMIFAITKLQRADMKFLKIHAEEMSKYYYLAARSALSLKHDEEAMKLLESSLELKPNYLEALNLFTELNVNVQNSTAILKVLKSAFANYPSFEIAELYIKCSRSSVDAIYSTLAGIVKPSEHQALFLAIAAYLGLYDKIAHIK